jgi:hypothetical protein
MSASPKRLIVIGSYLLASGALIGGSASTVSAQNAIPDFYQNGIGWVTMSNDFLQPKSGLGPVMSDPAHPYIMETRAGRVQTFRVADINHPALMPWVKDVLKKQNEQVLAGKPLYTVANSCRPAGVPNMLLVRITPFFFLQTPKEVWLVWQNDHMVRRVYLNQEHSKNLKPSWFGESVGHYENGDTLVVDTVGLNTKTTIDNYHTPHTEKLHVIERFHMVDSGNTMEVEVTIEDPGAFTQPFHALQRYSRADGRSGNDPPYLYEEVCAETAVQPVDIGMPPIPRADQPDF